MGVVVVVSAVSWGQRRVALVKKSRHVRKEFDFLAVKGARKRM